MLPFQEQNIPENFDLCQSSSGQFYFGGNSVVFRIKAAYIIWNTLYKKFGTTSNLKVLFLEATKKEHSPKEIWYVAKREWNIQYVNLCIA